MKKNIIMTLINLIVIVDVFGQSTKSDNVENISINSATAVFNPYISPNYPYVVCNGNTFTLNAIPNSASNTYQWYFSATEAGPYTALSGATVATYIIYSGNVGYYKVSINDGTGAVLSPPFRARVGATSSFTSTFASINAGQSVNTGLNFNGTPPYHVNLTANNSTINRDFNSTTNNLTLTSTPDAMKRYTVNVFYDANGVGCLPSNNIQNIAVNPTPTVLLSTPPSNLNVCAGNTIDIPITLSGTWGADKNIYLTSELHNTSGGNISWSATYQYGGGPNFKYLVSPGTPNGTYKIAIGGVYPQTSFTESTYSLNVVNSGCNSPQSLIVSKDSACSIIMDAYPRASSGYTYQWYKDNVAISGATFSTYAPYKQSGSFSVLVSNTALGYSALSSTKTITQDVSNLNLTSSSTNLCDGSVTISANNTGSNYSYQWYKILNSNVYNATKTPIDGANSSSLTVTTPGLYSLRTWNGKCQFSSNPDVLITVCPPKINSTNPSLCGGNTQAELQADFTNGVSYQWQSSATQYGTYTNIAGATNSSYIATAAAWYKVVASDGTNSVTSDAFQVSNITTARLLNSNGNRNTVNLNPGQTETLQLQMSGAAPFTYSFQGRNYTSNAATVSLPVTPPVATSYYVSSVRSAGSACGTSGISTSSIIVNVLPTPTFTIGTMASTACKGGFIEVPIIKAGNWGADGFDRISVSLNTAAGTYVQSISASAGYSLNGNNLRVLIPTTLTVGNSYKLGISGTVPYVNFQYTPNFTISNTCPTIPTAQIDELKSNCEMPRLIATPYGTGFTHEWRKDGVLISGENIDYYSPTTSGNYSVTITNTSAGYSSTASKSVTVNVSNPIITSSNSVLCGAIQSSTISSNITDVGYTYIWRKNSTIIAGATGSSITVNEPGRYSLWIQVPNCNTYLYSNEFYVTYGGRGTLTNESNNNEKVVISSPLTSANLKVTLTGTGPWEVAIIKDGNRATSKIYQANSSPFLIPVSPTVPTQYQIDYVSDACGRSSATGSNGMLTVEPAPATSIAFPVPSTNTVCIGNSISLPYVITGSYGPNTTFGVILGDPIGGYSRNIYSGYTLNINPTVNSGNVDLYIADNIPVGEYALLLYNSVSSVAKWSDYTINVTNTGCAAKPAPVVIGVANACGTTYLSTSISGSYFYGNPNTYQWYKNGVVMTGKTSENITVYESGDYSVQVINGAYNQTSAAKTITINRVIPTVTTTNPVICGSNTTATLSTNFTGAGYTYQWYKDRSFGDGTTEQIQIFGATNSSVNVTQTGNYSVKVFDGSCLHNSKSAPIDVNGNLTTGTAFNISATPNANLTNISGDNSAVTIAGGNSTQVRVTLTGGGPWTFDLIGSDGNTTMHTATTSPFDITVSPTVNTNYILSNLTSSCGVGTVSGNLTVIVSPPPSFTISGTSSPNQSGDTKGLNAGRTLCAGSTITIGYATNGNWPSNAEITVELVNSSTNAVISGTKQSGYNTNPILYFIPYNVPVGTYKVKLSSIKPYIETAVISSSSITLASTGCTAPDATIRAKTSCANSLLTAAPSGVGFTYQWYKNGTSIAGAISSDYLANEDGNYTVTVSNSSTGYTATSNAYLLSIEEINKVITSTGTNCGSGGSVTFTSNNVGGSYTHQWYFSTDNVYFTPISGATNNTYTTTTAGYYYVIIKTANCEQKSNVINTCIATINFVAKSVCQSSSVNVPFNFTGGENQQLTLQLIDATTSAVVINNLTTITSTINTNYNPLVSIPNSVTAGTYKFKVISNAPLNLSQIGNGVLTITGQTGGTAPTVTSSVSSVSTVQNVTISAIGCVGDVVWNNSDAVAQTFPSFSSSVNKNTTYTAYCIESSSGCISPSNSTTVTFNCADSYEPNNSTITSTPITINSFLSPVICLNGFDNPDWFSWTNNGQTYYIKASLASSQVAAGNYKLKLSISGTDLIVETLPENTGEILDTYLTLFAADGVTVLSMNDNGNANGFSKLIYGGISPCQSSIVLSNTGIDDISSGVVIKEANANTGTITATNKITGTANVTYRAGKSIMLDAGFKADNGTVFKTEFGGCN